MTEVQPMNPVVAHLLKDAAHALEEMLLRTKDLPVSKFDLKIEVPGQINEEMTYQDLLELQKLLAPFAGRNGVRFVHTYYNFNQRPPLFYLQIEVRMDLAFLGD